ncbi:DUF4260 domain-containing protein [Actinomadura macrotermitis]|uniref:DUF4260 family protein n=1 Tax=Actinomadura macrotermitis TaxID=2585200 RepID=A0A7K0BZH8_9ACTN|nr:DUF4260 domain-containing protein [Actinomadura macrotermitis]MQY06580.1 hypothetical protein [Actinomadura macrotermitis]
MTAERTRDEVPQPVSKSGGWTRKIGWGALALFLAAFTVFESVKYGVPTTAGALVFFVLPDAVRTAGARPPGVLYQAAHRVWIPLVVLVAYSIGPVEWPPLFTAALGWLTRIVVERVLGRGPTGPWTDARPR